MALDGGSVTFENSRLSAVITKANAWSITSLIDKRAHGEFKNVLKSGNLLQWRFDGGNLYRYGFEEGCGFDRYNAVVTGYDPVIVERGPLRTVVRAVISMTATTPAPLPPQNYTIEACSPYFHSFLEIMT